MKQLTRTINAEDAMDQVVLGHDHSLLIILEIAWDRSHNVVHLALIEIRTQNISGDWHRLH
jgi:hypothetical protein